MEPESPHRHEAPANDRPAFPRVDEQLVRPETREELVRGRAVRAAPAKEPHAEQHYELGYVTRAALARGYVGATDLLTRAGPRSDFATDTCIRREGIDPETGGRYLEELAFEVVSEQSRRDVSERAEDLTARGVRRIVGIFVKKGEVCEWRDGGWAVLDPTSALEDPTLVTPLPIRALLDRTEADRAVARALQAQGTPEIMAMKAEALSQGLTQGLTLGLEALCEAFEIPLGPERRAMLKTLDAAQLEALMMRIRSERRWS